MLTLASNNEIIKEISKYWIDLDTVESKSELVYNILAIYTRDAQLMSYMRLLSKNPRAVSVGLRYLYIMLLSFEELRLLDRKASAEVARILMEIVIQTSPED